MLDKWTEGTLFPGDPFNYVWYKNPLFAAVCSIAVVFLLTMLIH